MKLFLSLLLLIGLLLVSTSAIAHGDCDPRYYKPRTCEPYYTHPNPRGLQDPMLTMSRNPADYVGSNCLYGVCGYPNPHNHYNGCGHNYGYGYGQQPRQSRWYNWGVTGNVGSMRNGDYGNIGIVIGGGQYQSR